MVSEHGSLKAYRKGCRCDDCRAANAKSALEYYHRNKEKCLERLRVTNRKYEQSAKGRETKQRYCARPEREAVSKGYRESEDAKQKHRERCARYRKTDKNRAVQARYAKTEKGKASGSRTAHKRRAVKLEQFVEVVDRYVVFDRDEGICGLCGEAVSRDDFHVDHIVPIARGGEESYANVQVAHPSCNRKKGARGDNHSWQDSKHRN